MASGLTLDSGAAVVLGAAARGDRIVTSDPDDIGRLVAASGRDVLVLVV